MKISINGEVAVTKMIFPDAFTPFLTIWWHINREATYKMNRKGLIASNSSIEEDFWRITSLKYLLSVIGSSWKGSGTLKAVNINLYE